MVVSTSTQNPRCGADAPSGAGSQPVQAAPSQRWPQGAVSVKSAKSLVGRLQTRVRTANPLLRGFTLIELMIVMAIISILLAVAIPVYQKSIIRAKESVLRNNLFTLRNMIDEYTVDKQHAPETLDDLVSDGYLRQIPQDPITNRNDTWKITMEDTPIGGSNSAPGIFDVHSGSDKTALDGTAYADW